MTKSDKPKITLLMPDGLMNEIEKVMQVENRWISIQDFVRESVKEKIDRWKKEHPGHP
jgi:UTP:GlnB (protein PII) uridylyltransferase